MGNPFGPYPVIIPTGLFEPNGRLLIMVIEKAVEWPMDVRTWERFEFRAVGRDHRRTSVHDLLPNRP